ncbi:Asp-tRNA(Asn)/Glu-tRNA(Gln) amidotransferase subunit GatC [bacterium]|nr:Asp-tRNA(Asn)/Glu-tRNA(Gln) amidotransferase subunit GatC [bacterium]
MSVSRNDIINLAKLARMRLTEDEIEALQKDMNSILVFFDQLKKVDVSDVEPMVHPVKGDFLLEDDVPHESLPREVVLRDAPDRTEEYFRLPRVLGG